MGSGTGPRSINSRIYNNSFATAERAMAFPFKPNNYFGFNNRLQYCYNVYHQLADISPGAGVRGERWARSKNINYNFNPPN